MFWGIQVFIMHIVVNMIAYMIDVHIEHMNCKKNETNFT